MCLNFYFLPQLIASFLFLIFGLFVYFKNRKGPINFLFLLYSFVAFLWLFFGALATTANYNVSYFLFKISYTGIIFIPFLTFNFLLKFLEKKKLFFFKILNFLGYVFSFIFLILLWETPLLISGLYRYFFGFYPKGGNFHPIFLFIFFFYLSIVWLVLLYSVYFDKGISEIKRRQRKYFLLACFIYSFASFDFVGNYGIIEFYPIGFLFASLFVFIISYAIVKYNLMDIKLALSKGGVFLFVYSFVLGLPLLFGFFTNNWIVATFLGIFLASFGPFVYGILKEGLKDFFLRKQKIYQQVLNEFIKEISQIKELDKLLEEIPFKLFNILKPQFLNFYIFSKKENLFILKTRYGENFFDEIFSLNHPLIQKLNSYKKTFFTDEGVSPPDFHLFLLPFFVKDELFSFLIFGSRHKDFFYNYQYLDFFDLISSQCSLLFEKCLFLKEEKKQIMQLEQIKRQRAMDHFSASLAHEIDNPLFAISGMLEVIRLTILEDLKNIIPSDKLSFLGDRLERIKKDVLRISKMIKAIREFSAQTNGDFTLINFQEVLDNFFHIVEPQFKYEGVVFEKEIEREIYLIGNKIQLEEVLVNLATNALHAVKYNQKKEKIISLKIKKEENKLFIEFKDNGYGIEKDMLEDIFLDFVTTKASSEGSGLGLPQVRKIIERHKGRIWAESEGKNKGATFFIELPLAKKEGDK